MSDAAEFSFDLPNGEVTENTSYVAVPAGRYKATILDISMRDPVALGWKVREDPQRDLAPFVEVSWGIMGNEEGEPSEADGRRVRHRVSLLNGKVDKNGIPESKTRADYIRLRDGLGGKEEVIGRKLYVAPASGVARADSIAAITKELREAFVGLEGTIRTYSFAVEGEEKDGVGGLVLDN